MAIRSPRSGWLLTERATPGLWAIDLTWKFRQAGGYSDYSSITIAILEEISAWYAPTIRYRKVRVEFQVLSLHIRYINDWWLVLQGQNKFYFLASSSFGSISNLCWVFIIFPRFIPSIYMNYSLFSGTSTTKVYFALSFFLESYFIAIRSSFHWGITLLSAWLILQIFMQ
jgi:hypothetical protein